jgi:hypothetical protein
MSADGSSPVQSHSPAVVRTADAAQSGDEAAQPAKPSPVKAGRLAAPANEHTRLDHKQHPQSPTSPKGPVKDPGLGGTVKAGELADQGAAWILLPDTAATPKPAAAAHGQDTSLKSATPSQPATPTRHVASKAAHGQVASPAPATPTTPKNIRFGKNGEMQDGTVQGLLNEQFLRSRGVFIEDNVLDNDNVVNHGAKASIAAGKIDKMCRALATLIGNAGVEVVYTDLVEEPLLSRLLSNDKPAEEDLDELQQVVSKNKGNYPTDDDRDTMLAKLGSYVAMLRTMAGQGIQVRNIDQLKAENAPGTRAHKYVVIGDYARMSWIRSVAKLPTLHPNTRGEVTKTPNLKNHFRFDPTSGPRYLIEVHAR